MRMVTEGQTDLGQYMTPMWAAQLLVEKYFSNLTVADLVVEPSCGTGAFLQTLPHDVQAIGIEIDPVMAEEAARVSGRHVIHGDFRRVRMPCATVFLGNPPFQMDLLDELLEIAHDTLPMNGRCGFLLPAYAFQTWRRVLRWNKFWSIQQDMLPRRIFPELECPLVFARFTKDGLRFLRGFALYREIGALQDVTRKARLLLCHGVPGTGLWRALVTEALHCLGGKANLREIYGVLEKNPTRPDSNRFWRAKIRQELQRHPNVFRRTGPGVWEIVADAEKATIISASGVDNVSSARL